MNTIRTVRRLAATAATLALVAAAGSAHASFFNFDHDPADLVHSRAAFVFGAMNWGQTIGGGTVRGALTGQLTYHGGLAGCARVRVTWRSGTGAQLGSAVSREACSATSLPSLPVGVSTSFSSTSLRSALVEMQIREANGGGYRTVLSRTVKAGD